LSIIKLIITAVACVGLVARLKTITVVDVYFVIYFGLLLQDTIAGNAQGRFIIPILPFLLFYFLYGADRILHVATSRLIQSRAVVGRAISLLVVGLLALYLVRDIQQIAVPVRNRMTDLSVGAVWIKANTNDNAVVMCSDAVSRYLYLERPTVDFPRTDGPEELLNTIRRENVSFLLLAPKLAAQRSSVLDEHVKQAILPTLQANPEQFMLVYEEPTHALLVYKMTTQPSDVEQLP
jgi:hypothetical protein